MIPSQARCTTPVAMMSSATCVAHAIEFANSVCAVGRVRVDGTEIIAFVRDDVDVRDVKSPITAPERVQRTADGVGGVVSSDDAIMSCSEVPSVVSNRIPGD